MQVRVQESYLAEDKTLGASGTKEVSKDISINGIPKE
jgi:hypothetical protein